MKNMHNADLSNRHLKTAVGEWLERTTGEDIPEELRAYAARRLINPLLSFLYTPAPLIKWRAVTAIGGLVAGLADENMESARVIMRRLMWSLNDESGGIGWGAPESMGEIMTRHLRLAEEFHAMMISYLAPNENYLEHAGLQPGLLWGIGRLVRVRKNLMTAAEKFLPPYLASPDADIRGHAAWAAAGLDAETLRPVLKQLEKDNALFSLYRNHRLERITVGSAACSNL